MQVAISAINRRLEQNGHDGVFLIVKATGIKGSPDALMSDIAEAIEVANQALLLDGEEVVWAGDLLATSKGPIVNLDQIGTEEQNHEWLEAFAAELQTRGRSGNVTAAPQANFPPDLGKIDRPWLSAQLAFTLSDPDPHGYPPMTWLVDPEVTDEICTHAVQWARIEGATAYLREETFQFTFSDPDPSAILAAGIERTSMAGLSYLTGRPYHGSAIDTQPLGLVGYGTGTDGAPWQDSVDAIRDPMIFHAPRLDIGYVRYGAPMLPAMFMTWVAPELPHIDEPELRFNRPMLRHYAPDAHGLQVLTDSHLDKATDLSAWSTRALDNDRYLVEARDLEPWYTGVGLWGNPRWGRQIPQPDPEVLATARRDFGAMILTRAVLEADPTAWIRGRPHRPVIHSTPTRHLRRT